MSVSWQIFEQIYEKFYPKRASNPRGNHSQSPPATFLIRSATLAAQKMTKILFAPTTYLQILTIVCTLLCIRCDDSSLCIKSGSFNPQTARIYLGHRQQSFKELVTLSDYFVDKTQFVVDIVHQRKFTYIFSHWRSGKSLLLDMVRTYIQREVNADGSFVPWQESWAYKFFTKGEIDSKTKLRSPPKSAQFIPEIEKYLAKGFVILLDFSEVSATDCLYPTLLALFKDRVILKAYQEHDYVLPYLQKIIDNPNATDLDRENATICLNSINQIKLIPSEDVLLYQPLLKEAIRYLTRAFYLAFGEKTFVLIDNFDHPIEHIYYRNLTAFRELDASRRYIRAFFEHSVKLNELLAQGITFGVREIELFIRKKKVLMLDVRNNYLGHYFFLRQEEVDELLQLKQLQKFTEDVKIWYSGYYIGETRNISSYNIYSIGSFLNEGKIARYWTNIESDKIFFKVYKFHRMRWDFQNILCTGEVPMPDDLEYMVEDFFMIGNLLNSVRPYNISAFPVKFYFNHVYVAGYLSKYWAPVVRFVKPDGILELIFLQIPNYEIKSVMTEQLLEYYDHELHMNFSHFTGPSVESLVKYLHDGTDHNFALLQRDLHELYFRTSVYFDNRKNKELVDMFPRSTLNTENFHCLLFLLFMRVQLLYPRLLVLHEYSFIEIVERDGYVYTPDLMVYDEANKVAVSMELVHEIIQPLTEKPKKRTQSPPPPPVSRERYFSRFLKYRNLDEITIRPLEVHVLEKFLDPFNLKINLQHKTDLTTDPHFHNRSNTFAW